MKFKVHFVHDEHDCTKAVDALTSDAAANKIRREYPGAIVKKTKVLRTEEA